MPRYAYAQAHPQSCTAVAIMVTLSELGLTDVHLSRGREMMIHGQLKRDPTPGSGQEEILPHAAVQYLTQMGTSATVYQDKARTTPLKGAAPGDYAQFKQGLAGAGIGRTFGAIDLNTVFNNDARVFLIVGFFQGPALKTHTILMRQDGGSVWVMNPDGGTDHQYTAGQVSAFLNAPMTATFHFANRGYIYTGIATRVWR